LEIWARKEKIRERERRCLMQVRLAAPVVAGMLFLAHPQALRVSEPEPPEAGLQNRGEVAHFLRTRDYRVANAILAAWLGDEPRRKANVLRLLSAKLYSAREVGLANHDALYVESRAYSGKMFLPFPCGTRMKQDVFLENGRCAWAIEEMIGTELPEFTEAMARENLDTAVREVRRLVEERAAQWEGGS
jgi:hypothetical protein